MTDPNEFKSTAPPGFWSWARNDLQERVRGILEVLGIFVAAFGGWRQVFLAISLASIAGGLGLSIEHFDGSSGHCWMGFGGFLLGLIWPLKK